MKHVYRVLAATVLAAVSATAFGQGSMWLHDYTHRTNSKMTRDTVGGLYFATNVATTQGWRVNFEKFTTSGEKLWSKFVYSVRPDIETLHVVGTTANTTHLFAITNTRQDDVSAVVTKSAFHAIRSTNGVLDFNHFVDGSEFISIAVSGERLALLAKNVSTGVASVTFFQTGTWTNLGTVNLGVVSSAAEVKLDLGGNAYVAASNTNGTVQISKCSAAGGIAFQTTLDAPAPRINEKLFRLEVDTVAGRAFAMGTVAYSPTDQDVMLYTVDSLTGANVGIQSIRSSAADDMPGDLSIVPGSGGVIASAYTPSTEVTVVARRATTTASVWSATINGTPAGAGRSHGTDADGHLVIMSPTSASVVSMDRVNRVTGAILGRESFSIGPEARAHQLMTSSGVYYINADYRTYVPQSWTARFTRVQSSRLSFVYNNIVGGDDPVGRIHRSPTTTVEEVWTVTSGDPAIASVPPTVTVEAGLQTKNFPIITTPVTSNTNVSINIRFNGFVDQQTLTVIPSVIWRVRATPQVVIGGVGSQASVDITGAAPAGGLSVTLSSNKPTVASVSGTGLVPGGSDFAQFPITTYGVNSNQGVVISATTGSVTKTAFMAVNAPSLTSIAATPGTLKGGVTGTLTLNLNGIAPTGGFSIALFSGIPGTVILPSSASVSAGQTTRNVSMPTAAVSATTQVTIIATRSGIYKTTTVTVTP